MAEQSYAMFKPVALPCLLVGPLFTVCLPDRSVCRTQTFCWGLHIYNCTSGSPCHLRQRLFPFPYVSIHVTSSENFPVGPSEVVPSSPFHDPYPSMTITPCVEMNVIDVPN